MKRLVLTLADLHEDGIVLFDSPPLLVASESSALATHMSQILMVVAAGQTTEAAVKDALQRIQGCEGTVGMVLNKKLSRSPDHGYYGYGYGSRGYGTGHDG
jgi:Mrp family chromosome partitioning ATPase